MVFVFKISFYYGPSYVLAHASVESCLHLDVGIPLEVLYEQVVGGEHTLQPVLGDHRDGGPSTG